MSDATFSMLMVFMVIGIPILSGVVYGVYQLIQDALERRHERKLEIIRKEAEMRREIEQEWDNRFNKNIEGEAR